MVEDRYASSDSPPQDEGKPRMGLRLLCALAVCMLELQDRVTRFPQEAQDEVFRRAAKRNAECIAIARSSIDTLRKKLGLSD